MNFQGSPCIQSLATCFTVVAEAAQEVLGLHMVPDVSSAPVAENLTDGAHVLVGFVVLGKELVEVLGLLYVREAT